jgi:hypothetical protein
MLFCSISCNPPPQYKKNKVDYLTDHRRPLELSDRCEGILEHGKHFSTRCGPDFICRDMALWYQFKSDFKCVRKWANPDENCGGAAQPMLCVFGYTCTPTSWWHIQAVCTRAENKRSNEYEWMNMLAYKGLVYDEKKAYNFTAEGGMLVNGVPVPRAASKAKALHAAHHGLAKTTITLGGGVSGTPLMHTLQATPPHTVVKEQQPILLKIVPPAAQASKPAIVHVKVVVPPQRKLPASRSPVTSPLVTGQPTGHEKQTGVRSTA